MGYLKKEEVLQAITGGNRTIKGLAAEFGLTTGNMKGALGRLGIDLKEVRTEAEAIIMNNFSASDEDEWKKLYNDYDLEGSIGTQAQFVIAQCRIRDGMTAAQARQYMKDNFHYQTMEIKLNK